MTHNLITIGCSLGGLKALQTLLSGLSRPMKTPIAIVQHRDRDIRTGGMLTHILQKSAWQRIIEPEDKTPIEEGHIYLAPADYHLLIEDRRFVLSTEVPVGHARPSIDVTFDSAARCFGASLVGVLLTGSGQDGANGMAQIERRGGHIIVQDPVSAEQDSMPLAAISKCRAPTILPLNSIAPFLCSLESIGDRTGGSRENRATG
jgi:two-component system chemotaxis response regulator CheB